MSNNQDQAKVDDLLIKLDEETDDKSNSDNTNTQLPQVPNDVANRVEEEKKQNEDDIQKENGSSNIQQNSNQDNNEIIADQQNFKQVEKEVEENSQQKQDIQQIDQNNNNATEISSENKANNQRNEGSKMQVESSDCDALNNKISKDQSQNLTNDISNQMNIEEDTEQQLQQQQKNTPPQQIQQIFNQPSAIEERNDEKLQFQQLTYQEKQQLQEIQFYVYQDLANILGVLTDATETLKHFQDQPKKEYVPIAINRMVLQANLSNGIHFDCGFNFKSQGQKEQYWKEKQNASRIFDNFYKQFNISNNDKLKECVELFKYNLTQKPELKQLSPIKVQQTANFNQKTVQQIFDGMIEVNQLVDRINKGEYQKLQEKDFEGIVIARRERAQKLLNQNFPHKGYGKQDVANQEDHR